MGFFEITAIKKNGTTGKRLGVVESKTRSGAVNKLAKSKRRIPRNVRVFPVKVTKIKKTK
tara:strand:+ start:165 stop:344 length:180 start_codon:yes stop_codon:yes gene_type:complete